MVGNIRLINADVATRQYNPALPTIRMAPAVVHMAQMANTISSMRPLTYFISMVLTNLPLRNKPMARILYHCAVDLLIPKLSAYCMINVQHIICVAT